MDSNLISQDLINQYIQWSDQYINSVLNVLYVTPFSYKCDLQVCLFQDISQYNNYIITQQPCGLAVGDKIQLRSRDGLNSQFHFIKTIIDIRNQNIFQTQDTIQFQFESGSRISRLKYPQPISFLSASLSSAYIYDKFFMAQASPNESEYAKTIRSNCQQILNNILQGRTVLHGVSRRSRRLYNPNIIPNYGLPQGNAGSRSIDKTSG